MTLLLASAWRRAMLSQVEYLEETFGVTLVVEGTESAERDIERMETRLLGTPISDAPDPVLASGSRALDALEEALKLARTDERIAAALLRARARLRLEQGLPMSYRDVSTLADVSDALVRLRVQEGAIERAGVGSVRAASAREWLVERQRKAGLR